MEIERKFSALKFFFILDFGIKEIIRRFSVRVEFGPHMSISAEYVWYMFLLRFLSKVPTLRFT